MNPTERLSPVKVARRDKILDAALQLFSQYGFRATTMEGISVAVGMSKATVYSYFGDKDAVFAAVVQRLNQRLEKKFRDGIQADAPLVQRFGDAFVSNFTICYEVKRSSPSALELFATSNESIANANAALSLAIEQMLHEALTNAGRSAAEASTKARLLVGAVKGISDNAKDVDVAVADMRRLVAAIV